MCAKQHSLERRSRRTAYSVYPNSDITYCGFTYAVQFAELLFVFLRGSRKAVGIFKQIKLVNLIKLYLAAHFAQVPQDAAFLFFEFLLLHHPLKLVLLKRVLPRKNISIFKRGCQGTERVEI